MTADLTILNRLHGRQSTRFGEVCVHCDPDTGRPCAIMSKGDVYSWTPLDLDALLADPGQCLRQAADYLARQIDAYIRHRAGGAA